MVEMSNDLDTLDFPPTMYKVNVLHHEKATFHPLETNLSIDIWTGYLPGTNQSVHAFKIGIGLRWLICSLNIIIFCHDYLSFAVFK